MSKTLSRINKQLQIVVGSINLRRGIILLLRLIVGISFIYRGGLMVSDPIGVAMKAEDVLFETGAGLLLPLAYIFAFVVSSLKLMIGVSLVLGASIVTVALYLICFQLFDLMVRIASGMTSGGELLMSVSFILIGVLIIQWRKSSIRLYTQRTEWIISVYSFAYSVLLASYCYFTLPIIDRTVAKEGDYLSGVFVNEADMLGCGRETEDVMKCLPDTGYCFVLLSENIANASTMDREKLNNLYDYSVKENYPFICLIGKEATDIEVQEYVIESAGAEYEFKRLDERVIKTIARSNPELLILKDGVILRKFSAYKIPEIDEDLEHCLYGHKSESDDERTILYCILWFAIPLLVVLLYDYFIEFVKYLFDRYLKGGKKREKAEELSRKAEKKESPASQGDSL